LSSSGRVTYGRERGEKGMIEGCRGVEKEVRGGEEIVKNGNKESG
jgi:hypothetical protein